MGEEMELDERELDALEASIDKLLAKMMHQNEQLTLFAQEEEERFTRLEQSITNISKMVATLAMSCDLAEPQVVEGALGVFDEMPKRVAAVAQSVDFISNGLESQVVDDTTETEDPVAKSPTYEDTPLLFGEMPVRDFVSWAALSKGTEHESTRRATEITGIFSVGGDRINLASTKNTAPGFFFVKTNSGFGPSVFEGKISVHSAMYATNLIRVPKPYKVGVFPTGAKLFDLAILSGKVYDGGGSMNLKGCFTARQPGGNADVYLLDGLGVSNAPITMYCKCGSSPETRNALKECAGAVSWRSSSAGHSPNCMYAQGFQHCSFDPDGIRGDLQSFVSVSTSLIDMYGKGGCWELGKEVFRHRTSRDIVISNILIAALGMYGRGDEAILFFNQMRIEKVEPNKIPFIALFSACDPSCLVQLGLLLYNSLLEDYGSNMFKRICQWRPMSQYRLPIIEYDICGASLDVYFPSIEKGVFSLLATNGDSNLGSDNFVQRIMSYFIKLMHNKYGMEIGDDDRALAIKQAHTRTLKTVAGPKCDGLLMNKLVPLYSEFGGFQSATMVFFIELQHAALSWTEVSDMFLAEKNPSTLLRDLRELHRMLTFVITLGLDSAPYVKCALLDFHGDFLGIESTNEPCEDASVKSSALWNKVVTLNAQYGQWLEALKFFQQMHSLTVNVDEVTFGIVLHACGRLQALEEKTSLHGYAIQSELSSALLVNNVMIAMYSNNASVELAIRITNLVSCHSMISGFALHGFIADALELFNKMVLSSLQPVLVSWHCSILGHSLHGSTAEVMNILRRMQAVDFQLNSSFIINVLRVVSDLGLLHELGRQMHGYVMRHGLAFNVYVSTSLIDKYSKCCRAWEVLVSRMNRNGFTWTSLNSGCAHDGFLVEAMELLKKPLASCAKGSKILVTMGRDAVAREMQAIHTHLGRTVMGYHRDVGMEIGKNCDGLPLAIKAIAGVLMATKRWLTGNQAFQDPAWKSTELLPDGVLESLYLSCKALEGDLNQCFLYFSLVPNSNLLQGVFARLCIAEECQFFCLKTCSYVAYSDSSKCLIWVGALMDGQELTQVGGCQDPSRVLYFRLAVSEFPTSRRTKLPVLLAFVIALVGTIISGVALVLIWRRRRMYLARKSIAIQGFLRSFGYRDLRKAIGTEGFGSVFKTTPSDSAGVATG